MATDAPTISYSSFNSADISALARSSCLCRKALRIVRDRLFNRQRFFDEIEGAQLGRAHRSLDISVTRNNHHGDVAVGVAHLLQSLEAADSRQPHIQQDTTVCAPRDRFEAFFARFDRVSVKALIAQHRAQRLANPAFVVND
jgi:hypothetical protein